MSKATMKPPKVEMSYLVSSDGVKIAYNKLSGAEPGIIFFGGFASDMEGTKALALQDYAMQRGQAFLRFDYRGHGKSSGVFTDGNIGKWLSDCLAVLDNLTQGCQILIGSSMGGWLVLLTAKERPERVGGILGIASAPDFTEDLMWLQFDDETKQKIMTDGQCTLASEYDESPYVVTRELIEDGRRHLVLRNKLEIEIPFHLIHGMADEDVPYQLSLKLAEHVDSQNVHVNIIKSGDHRLSREQDLVEIFGAVESLSGYSTQ